MKIIKNGKLNDYVGKVFTCVNCACQYQVEKLSDLQKSITTGDFVVSCPECSSLIYIEKPMAPATT